MNFMFKSFLFALTFGVMSTKDVFFGSLLNLDLSDEETSGNLWSMTLHDETFTLGEFNVDDRFVNFLSIDCSCHDRIKFLPLKTFSWSWC